MQDSWRMTRQGQADYQFRSSFIDGRCANWCHSGNALSNSGGGAARRRVSGCMRPQSVTVVGAGLGAAIPTHGWDDVYRAP